MVKKVSLLIVMVIALLPVVVFAQSTSTPTPTPTASPRVDQIKIEGIVESLQDGVLVIGGQSIDVSSAVIDSDVAVGSFAEAFVTLAADRAWVASRVELARNENEDDDLNEVEIRGVVTEVGVDFVVIGGQRFDTSLAEVEGTIVAGAFVELELQLNDAGQWVAVELKLDDDNDQNDDRDDDLNDDHGRNSGHDDANDNSGPGNSGDDNSGPGDNSGSDSINDQTDDHGGDDHGGDDHGGHDDHGGDDHGGGSHDD
jgi:hypothetical protein